MYGIIGYEMVREVAKILAEAKSAKQDKQQTIRPVVRLLGKLWLPTTTHLTQPSDKVGIKLDAATQK